MRPRLVFDRDVLCVVPVGAVPSETIESVLRGLRAAFGFSVVVGRLPIDPAAAFDAARGQYDATRLLLELHRYSSSAAVRIIGITQVDLCNAVLHFVLGEAQAAGNVGITSSFRLRDEGAPGDPERFRRRLLQVILHELGHEFGLHHCEDERCIMHVAQHPDDLDLQDAAYCPACLEKLRWEIRRETRLPLPRPAMVAPAA